MHHQRLRFNRKLFKVLNFSKDEETLSSTSIGTHITCSQRNITYINKGIKCTCCRWQWHPIKGFCFPGSSDRVKTRIANPHLAKQMQWLGRQLLWITHKAQDRYVHDILEAIEHIFLPEDNLFHPHDPYRLSRFILRLTVFHVSLHTFNCQSFLLFKRENVSLLRYLIHSHSHITFHSLICFSVKILIL